MARIYDDVNSAPFDEPVAQPGQPGYATRARLECRAWIAELKAALGDPPVGAELAVKGMPHETGTYYEVVVVYDDGNEAAAEYAFNCGEEPIANWTEAGLAILNGDPLDDTDSLLAKVVGDSYQMMDSHPQTFTAIIEP